MEQNNFEKNIHRKLEDLKVDPSDSVWENVQKHIANKEKKRSVIFILFFLFLLISLGGFWLFNSITSKKERNLVIAKTSVKDSRSTNTLDSSFIKPGINHDILTNSDTTKANYRNKKNEDIQHEKNVFYPKKTVLFSRTRQDSSESTNNKESHFLTNKSAIPPLENVRDADTKIKKEETILPEENKKDSLQTQPELQKNNHKTISKNDSVTKKHSKKVQKHPWTFGITFSGGNSFTTRKQSATNTVYSDPSSYGNGSGIPGSYSIPSEFKKSSAFFVGAILEKNISRQNQVSFGISYQYFSLLNKVGNTLVPSNALQYLNSSGNLYSANNTGSYYRNEFHFLEIPVSFNFHLNKNKSIPLFWNAGINISELISSNALQFQSNPGVYYNDNSFFNKTQFALHTGFSVTLFSKEKTPLSIGPYYYYSLSNVANEGLYTKTHFNYFGIETKILFRKK